MKAFPLIVMVVVAVAVVGGFFFIGSPAEERARRFDERRVNDLQTLQYEIINYWQLKNTLPQNLDILKDDIRGFRPPQDPETGKQYEYRAQGPLSLELCATFNRASGIDKNWAHVEGRACFTRTIDKDLYPNRKSY